jgi:uncharacterized UPF0160 family protein
MIKSLIKFFKEYNSTQMELQDQGIYSYSSHGLVFQYVDRETFERHNKKMAEDDQAPAK